MDLENKNISELTDLCSEIRKQIIDVVLKNGGHLASNLGIVELTVALKKIFKFDEDKILFDVGHQSYVYKILTDRNNNFDTLRTIGGISPFLDPEESSYDCFISGHAGSALSAGSGIAVANPNDRVIVVIGDASIANGHSLEALNNMINLKNIIVILNDNDMSIGKSVGCLSRFFSKMMLSKTYFNLKKDVKNITNKGNIGKLVQDTLGRAEHSIKSFFMPLSISENIGFKYFGVIDGHNLEELISVFEKVKLMEGPIFIHVKTKKGKGYLPAEEDREKFHGVSPYNPFKKEGEKIYSDVFGDKICDLASKDKNIVAISAGMVKGTGLKKFFEDYKDRAFDIGIAEGHGITFAGGLAKYEKKPYFAIYSTFLQRGIGQLIHDISLQDLPIKLMIDRAGIVGEDGKTHHGLYDISFLIAIPNFLVLAPTTKKEMEEMMEFSLDCSHPLAIRYSKGNIFDIENDGAFEIGKWREIENSGGDNLYIATGSMLKEILDIKEKLIERKLLGTIVSAGSIMPFDCEYIEKNFEKYKNIFILEEGYEKNGFASEIINFINEKGIIKKIHKIGIENGSIPHGKRNQILELCGLRGERLLKRIEGKINGEI